jgi:tetratricopeptide (TPR) repeat protein
MEDNIEDWKDNKYMRIHVWWHYALFKLYNLDFGKLTEVYKSEIRRKNDPLGMEDLDAASLLWRVKLLDRDQDFDEKELLENWEQYTENTFYCFNDLHALLVYFATKEEEKANNLIEKSINHNCSKYYRGIITSTFEGLKFFSEGKYKEAYTALENILKSSSALGGSNAQRDVFEMTAIEAAVRAGDVSKANYLINNGRCFKHDSPLKRHYINKIRNNENKGVSI